MQLRKTDDDLPFSGRLNVERAEDGLTVGSANIVDDSGNVVAKEIFDIRAEEDGVAMFGVVDPDGAWMAEAIDLHSSGSNWVGEGEDEAGETATVQLRRSQ
jgi:hypothetical protein